MSYTDHVISLQDKDDVIDKILKVISGELSFETITTDPDLAPLKDVLQSGGPQPCPDQ